MASRRQARKCKGHKKDGSPCVNWAMTGQLVCHAHGGRAAQRAGEHIVHLVGGVPEEGKQHHSALVSQHEVAGLV